MMPEDVRKAVERLSELAPCDYETFKTIRAHLLAREAEVERLQDSVNSLGLESAEHFVRGREWAERCGKQEARAERAEAVLREIRDSTFRNATTLRGMVDRYLSHANQQELP